MEHVTGRMTPLGRVIGLDSSSRRMRSASGCAAASATPLRHEGIELVVEPIHLQCWNDRSSRGFTRPGRARAYARVARAITMRWISLVPS